MPISPPDLLRLAQQLGQHTDDEVCVRSAVSRAYYAGLHATQQTFAGRDRMGNESSHHEIIGRATAYGKGVNPGRGAAAQIAHMLGKLRRQRNEADYDVGDDFFDAQQCEAVLLRAAEVLRLCQEVAQIIPAAKA